MCGYGDQQELRRATTLSQLENMIASFLACLVVRRFACTLIKHLMPFLYLDLTSAIEVSGSIPQL